MLLALNVASTLSDVSPLRRVGLHKLKGDRRGQWAMTANDRWRISLDLGVPSGRITDIINGRRSITADTALRFGHYFGNNPQFWLDLQSQYEITVL